MQVERKSFIETELRGKTRKIKLTAAGVSGIVMGALASQPNHPWLALPLGALGLLEIYSLERDENLAIIHVEGLSHHVRHTHNALLDEIIFQDLEAKRRKGRQIDATELWFTTNSYRRDLPQMLLLGDEPFWYAVRSKQFRAARSLTGPTLEVINRLSGQRPDRSELERETVSSVNKVGKLLPLI